MGHFFFLSSSLLFSFHHLDLHLYLLFFFSLIFLHSHKNGTDQTSDSTGEERAMHRDPFNQERAVNLSIVITLISHTLLKESES